MKTFVHRCPLFPFHPVPSYGSSPVWRSARSSNAWGHPSLAAGSNAIPRVVSGSVGSMNVISAGSPVTNSMFAFPRHAPPLRNNP
jgi:hypothetical protein